jgi:putative sigma-54 modulation protein
VQINVTGRHMEVTDALREHAEEKIARELAEFPRVQSVHVILAVEKYRHTAEIVAQAPHHIRVEAKEESDDMYVSIDRAAEKIEKQLHKVWDKLQGHKSRERLSDVELDVQGSEEKLP